LRYMRDIDWGAQMEEENQGKNWVDQVVKGARKFGSTPTVVKNQSRLKKKAYAFS
jgi:hypothetical protein